MTRLISWNVNGIRAVAKKNFFDWLHRSEADIVCLQETKAHPDQISEDFLSPAGYRSYWMSAEKKGYSGTVLYTKEPPREVSPLGVKEFDDEGRVLVADYGSFVLVNCYFPNSQPERARLDYKLAFNRELRRFCDRLSDRRVIICGDFNVAHRPIDLARPKQNENSPGYYIEEREWMDSFLAGGYTDVFRSRHPEPEQYTWWSYRSGARARNVGWRIDYFCVNQETDSAVKEAGICADVTGSDHCPISLELDLPE